MLSRTISTAVLTVSIIFSINPIQQAKTQTPIATFNNHSLTSTIELTEGTAELLEVNNQLYNNTSDISPSQPIRPSRDDFQIIKFPELEPSSPFANDSPVINSLYDPETLPRPFSPELIPTKPNYIRLASNTYRMVIDFNQFGSENGLQITLPARILNNLPTYEGEIIFPNNFCGFNITKINNFYWQDTNGNIVTEYPYNNIPDSTSLLQEVGDAYFLGGVRITGPIGACNNGIDQWIFEYPFTVEGTNPRPNLKLVIELSQDSEIQFLNYGIKQHPLDYDEIFKEKNFDNLMNGIFNIIVLGYFHLGLENYDELVNQVCYKLPDECPYFGSDPQ
jgi:hypothetical protein